MREEEYSSRTLASSKRQPLPEINSLRNDNSILKTEKEKCFCVSFAFQFCSYKLLILRRLHLSESIWKTSFLYFNHCNLLFFTFSPCRLSSFLICKTLRQVSREVKGEPDIIRFLCPSVEIDLVPRTLSFDIIHFQRIIHNSITASKSQFSQFPSPLSLET